MFISVSLSCPFASQRNYFALKKSAFENFRLNFEIVMEISAAKNEKKNIYISFGAKNIKKIQSLLSELLGVASIVIYIYASLQKVAFAIMLKII